MKILYGMILHETNTFSCRITDLKEWASAGIYAEGEEATQKFGNCPLYLGGMSEAAKEFGVELIPSITIANTGPIIERECLEEIIDTYLKYVKKHLKEIDGIYLALHGAGCAKGVEDIEGYVLSRTREVVGSELPITLSLDLHGNITKEMVEGSNGLFGVKEYPHIDQNEAGYNAVKNLVDIINGKSLQIGFVPLPMMVPTSNGSTFDMPMKSFVDFIKEYETQNNLEGVTFFHGFPYSDIEACRSSVIVMAKENAQKHAQIVAKYIWDNRRELDVECLMPDEAIDRALEIVNADGEGYVVINEASDNPGGGCPCDGTHLLRELIERDIPKSILAYIHDPEIARKAHEVGVGGYVSGLLGGKKETCHGEPIQLENALVRNLSNGECTLVTPVSKGSNSKAGKSARLRCGNVEFIVIESLPHQVYDDRPFLMTGADINEYDIVCVKSTNHFKGFFKSRAKGIVATDPPGLHTANFKLLDYKNIQRPIYPLDENVKIDQIVR